MGRSSRRAHTFEANTYGREAAGDWLRAEELRLNAEGASWRTLSEHAEDERIRAAAETVPTFAEYADVWLRARKVKGQPLQESTKRGYLIWLRKYLLPTFGEMPLNTITAADVVRWYEGLPHDKGKTVRECYALAKAIMKSATAADGVLPGAVNPFAIDGAGTIGKRSDKRTEVIEDADLALILATIRPEWRAMVGSRTRLWAAVRRDRRAPTLGRGPPREAIRRPCPSGRQHRPGRQAIREGPEVARRHPRPAHPRQRRHRPDGAPADLRHWPRGAALPRAVGRLAAAHTIPGPGRRMARRTRGRRSPDQLPRPPSDRRYPTGTERRARRRGASLPGRFVVPGC